MTLTRRAWLYLSALWLSLGVVLGHALLPPGPWLHGPAGSAFSVFTTDPVLGQGRGEDKAKARRAGDDRERHPGLADGGGAVLPPTPPFPAPAPRATTAAEATLPRLAMQAPPRSWQARAPPYV